MNQNIDLVQKNLVKLFISTLLLFPIHLYGQACGALSGTATLASDKYCKTDTLRPVLSGQNVSPGFSTELVVINDEGVIVQSGIKDEEVKGLENGMYTLHIFNFEDANPPSSPPTVGFTIGDIATEGVNCYDLSAAIIFEITDTTEPVAVCSDQTIELYLDEEGMLGLDPNDFDFGSYDDGCEGIERLELDFEVFGCDDIGNQEVKLIVIDTVGNRDSCVTVLEIRDTISPSLTCVPFSIDLSPLGIGEINTSDILSNAEDNCDSNPNTWLEAFEFTCDDVGTFDIKAYASDLYGNTDSCTVELTVRDTTGPIMECQTTSIYLDEEGEANLSPNLIDGGSTDNCGVIKSLSLSKSTFDCDDLGSNTVTLSVEDNSSNRDQCTAEVIVLDTINPVAECRDTTVYLDENGLAIIEPSLIENGSSDNCGEVTGFTLETISLSCTDLGAQSIWMSIDDNNGNQDTCRSTITVMDTFPPTPICRPFTIFTNNNGLAVLRADSLDNGSFDICSEIDRFDVSKSSYTCGDLGSRSVMLYVYDESNNVDSCSTTLTIIDTIPPVLSCKPHEIYLNSNGTQTLDVVDIDEGSTDNCGSLEKRYLSRNVFDCNDLSTLPVTLYIEDPSGNKDSCQTTVTVYDTIAPVAKCKPFDLQVGPDGETILTPDLINNLSTDNCAELSFGLSENGFDCSDLGPNEVQLYVFDASANSDTCTSIVTVIDLNKPNVLIKNIEVNLGEDGTVSVEPEALDAGSTDNCTIDSLWLDKKDFDCSNVGPNLVTLTARDLDGNIDEEIAIITVIDNSLPQFTCPSDLTVNTDLDGAGSCGVLIFDNRLNPSELEDNCSIERFIHNIEGTPYDSTLIGAAFDVGSTLIKWVITDSNGGKDSCSFTLTVLDNESPIASCKDTVLVNLNEGGMLSIDSMTLDNGSQDNCGIVSYEINKTDFNCTDVGYSTVMVTMKDAAGNRDECSVVVGIVASEACELPEISNAKGPNIADPCTCRGNGAFDEEVVIGPTTNNQTWTVKSTTLLDPNTLMPYAVGTAFSEIPINTDSSIYVIQGVHLDGEGYMMTAESPVFEDLSISNICYYPQAEIIGLDGPICLFTTPIPLEGSVANNVSGFGTFTINGDPASILDPMALGVGMHIVSYSFDAGNPSGQNNPPNTGCVSTVTKQIEITETSSSLACLDLISVSSNVSCEIEIVPQMLLSGNYYCYDDYEVLVAFEGVAIPNPVPADFAGEILNVLVRHQLSGRFCSGNVWLKDVTGPQVVECAASISDRFICTDVDSILNNPVTLDSTSKFYTGLPVVVDNCTGTSITFNDVLVNNGNCNGNIASIIRRTFYIEDQFGNASSCEQLIEFVRPDTVYFPSDTLVKEDCTQADLALDENGNIAPEESGFPFVLNGFGDTVSLLNGSICHFALSYTDQVQEICAAQKITIRTWRLFDGCSGAPFNVDIQLIETGDYDAPIVSCAPLDLNFDGKVDNVPSFSTTPFDCSANITIPEPEVMECSDYTVETRIYTWLKEDQFGFPTFDSVFALVPNVQYIGNEASNVPVGNHFFVYTVRDICNNVTRDTCAFKVIDGIAPVVFCEDDLTVSLSDNSFSRVFASDIDEGSRDNCDGQDLTIEIRRVISESCSNSGNSEYSEWDGFVDLDCCDAGTLVPVELRFTDKSGNRNFCSARLVVEDKISPICIPPFNVSIDCDQLTDAFDPFDLNRLQNSFGIPTTQDNCEAIWTELDPVVDINQCKVGSITRFFTVTDPSGNTSNSNCSQTITFEAVHDYVIKFPADAEAICGTTNGDSLYIEEYGCDLFAVNIFEDEFEVSPTGCYKIERTYKVINWCEYDGISDPVIIPRDADCDGEPGDEDVWVRVVRNDTTFLDRNDDHMDNIPEKETKETTCDGLTNPDGYWTNSFAQPYLKSRGYWEYTQFISVYDNIDPVINYSQPDPFCSVNNECTAQIDYNFTVEENCTPDDLSFQIIVDIDNDSISDYELPADSLTGTYPNYRINGVFPLGTHRFILNVIDGCGNESKTILLFSIEDCKAPAPICQDGLIAELSRLEVPVDLDGDLIVDLAAAYVWANDFAASPVDDCSGPVFYSINRVGEPAFPDLDSIQLTCNDEGIVLVEVHAWDQKGNHDYCSTFIDVQNNRDACREIPKGAIYGIIATETDMPIQNVEVTLSGDFQNMAMSGYNGAYSFLELEEQNDYSVKPILDINDQAGITTFDLILIRKHILGVKLLDSPYKIIAADANNSKNVSVLDLIQLQKLILNIDVKLANNESWRFVDKKFQFPNVFDPWQTGFPGVININNLDREYYDADFIAIKVGDVNISIDPNTATQVEGRSNSSPVYIDMIDKELEKGELVEIPIFIKNLEQLEGYQFGLQYDYRDLELVDIEFKEIGPASFGVFEEEGMITTSWYRTDKKIDPKEALFVLQFQSRRATSLKEALALSSRLTQVEAYNLNGAYRKMALRFDESIVEKEAFALYQNRPNPVGVETYIDFFLPEKLEGKLSIFDQNGRVIRQLKQSFDAGKHSYRFEVANLSPGMYYYKFESDQFTATKKMVIIR